MPYYPKFAVITPSFNQGSYIEETIRSVLLQNYPNLEFIIIDGESDDNSAEIIRDHQDHLAYWVSEPDNGQSDAINKGFKIATGEVLTWLNSDDYYLPGTLHKVANYFLEHPDVDCVYGDLHIVDENGELLYISKASQYDYRTMLYGGARVPQPASFFRKRILDRVGLLDPSLFYTMDIDLFIRFGQHNVNFAHIPHPLAAFRMHKINKTQDVKSFKKEVRFLTTKHAGRFFENKRLQNIVLGVMQAYYRLRAFSRRGLTRGDFIPFRTRWARWKISH